MNSTEEISVLEDLHAFVAKELSDKCEIIPRCKETIAKTQLKEECERLMLTSTGTPEELDKRIEDHKNAWKKELLNRFDFVYTNNQGFKYRTSFICPGCDENFTTLVSEKTALVSKYIQTMLVRHLESLMCKTQTKIHMPNIINDVHLLMESPSFRMMIPQAQPCFMSKSREIGVCYSEFNKGTLENLRITCSTGLKDCIRVCYKISEFTYTDFDNAQNKNVIIPVNLEMETLDIKPPIKYMQNDLETAILKKCVSHSMQGLSVDSHLSHLSWNLNDKMSLKSSIYINHGIRQIEYQGSVLFTSDNQSRSTHCDYTITALFVSTDLKHFAKAY